MDIAAVVFSNEEEVLGKTSKADSLFEQTSRFCQAKEKEDKEAMKGKFYRRWSWAGEIADLTLKALHAIQESDVVAIPVSDSGLKKPGENADQMYMAKSVRLIRSSDKFIRRSGKKR